MGSLSIWHWLIVLAVVLVLFGGGKRLSSTMGDLGRGLRIFRKEVADLQSEDTLLAQSDISPASEQPAGHTLHAH
ncbi:twin-arginine translocase TatA/TatE family subunit [Gluconacetobacter sp. 1b LMG 1731]|uniref:Sec-independent protein translocase protein TatA n=1 Tax=Gluconacetobacter dulcium TaxID=2729096 RepID=A0A7W4ILR7_9PROT|nr:twin-arginine translocase TatA/TatE family subunit [Gluconacetobacter dulcium]MBB2165211.1 twin-arginine translocase TatA/TatE family subunit [Gluconacetobacter dulcium]MBB2194380.1 twin-arginine translocase TatA/TatE family subunit [Gluconacetobacter dulcium]